MEDDVEDSALEIEDEEIVNTTLRLRPDELLAFQRELKEEKELLQKILTTIQKQIHSLQVEQLHLLGLMNKSLNEEDKKCKNVNEKTDKEEPSNRTLDLKVPKNLHFVQEELDEEEDDEM